MDGNLNKPENNNMFSTGSNDIFVANPYLKTLLVVLIFVFLGCGIFLVILMQLQNSYRQALYDQTQAVLPKHRENRGQ